MNRMGVLDTNSNAEPASPEQIVERLNNLVSNGHGYSLDEYVLIEGQFDIFNRDKTSRAELPLIFIGELGINAISRVGPLLYKVEFGIPLGVRNQLRQYDNDGWFNHALKLTLAEPWSVQRNLAAGVLIGSPQLEATISGSFITPPPREKFPWER